MKNHGQAFLETLASYPTDSFESRFSLVSNRLGLGDALGRNELQLLYQTTYFASRCNLAINGLAEGQIRSEDEPRRSRVERDFMVARDMFFASPGWQNLSPAQQMAIEKIFLDVQVAERNLAA